MTRAISVLPEIEQKAVFEAVRNFTAFTEENDPHSEHDCATLMVGDHEIMFKIDYYDPTLTYGSEDPTDPTKTTRVMTVMLSSDY